MSSLGTRRMKHQTETHKALLWNGLSRSSAPENRLRLAASPSIRTHDQYVPSFCSIGFATSVPCSGWYVVKVHFALLFPSSI